MTGASSVLPHAEALAVGDNAATDAAGGRHGTCRPLRRSGSSSRDRGFTIPSPALLGKIGAGCVRAIERFASRNEIPLVRFQRRESKEEVAWPYCEQAEREGRFGLVMIGVAQERARVWAGRRQGG